MCGLAGFVGDAGRERSQEIVGRMLQAQGHRGPDSTGVWCGTVAGADIGLGLARLKILDLSDAANQPMVSTDGRYVLVYNGEIYNYLELRDELIDAGACFRTSGDTEVVLQALIRWGPDAFARFNGMWALALLDVMAGEVTLSRDRFGIKPLYRYTDERGCYFGSEIKTILAVSRRRFQVPAEVASAFLCQDLQSTSTTTFFAGIEEFPKGSWAVASIDDFRRGRVTMRRHWSLLTTASAGLDESTLVDAVRTTFIDAVKLRLRSDVPVGVLLSGGMDSSAIAAALHQLAPGRSDIRLISAIGTNGADEQPFVDAMATHLNRHVEKVRLDYSPPAAFDLVGLVSWFNDQPVGSFSTVAHYLLMNRAKDLGVTVVLSGQGADEILCGYMKYVGFYAQELLRSGRWLRAGHVLGSFLAQGTVLRQIRYREAKRYLPGWLRLSEIDVRGPALRDVEKRIPIGLNGGRVIDRQVLDVERFSVPSLVHYEDRMSMALAREVRLPFLDWRLVNLLVSLPVEYKLRNGWTKWIFRRAMEPLLPRAIAWRKDKRHFIVPQNEWLRLELREQVRKLLESEWVTEHLGLTDRRKVRTQYSAYVRQSHGNGRLSFKDVFTPIALELWARRFEAYLSP
jgi:asparagine synthase (glutamine-hydrolysing)